MTTETEATSSALLDHDELERRLNLLINQLADDVGASPLAEPNVSELLEFLGRELLPHAIAEEHSLYRAGADVPGVGATIERLLDEHRALEDAAATLADATNGHDALAAARHFGWLFHVHLEREHDVLLPALTSAVGVNFANLVEEMHRLLVAAQHEAGHDPHRDVDLDANLLSLLLATAKELARLGEGDRACRAVASAWSVLRVPRADLAARATAHLHGLVKLLASEPVSLRANPGLGEDQQILDVRQLAPAQRHHLIFEEFHKLEAARSYVLVNDHDPKPLRYQFEAEYAGTFTWDYLEAGPSVWRVRIGRSAS